MPKKFFSLLFIVLFFASAHSAYAIEDPLAKPNNKIGIHILFTTEVQNAAKLINNNGGDWGYVTIPIQSSDHDFKKWQQFMNNCKYYHVIPIIRLATTIDPNNTSAWKKPHLSDIIESANFLNALSWPTQNRYIIVYNEVNRGDEWGGEANPAEYARILSFATTVFKSKSSDFFIISAGLDNAAPNRGKEFINEYEFMRQMNTAVPGIFFQVDGLASHSYPNPGFSQSPSETSFTGVASFFHERNLARELTGKTLPIFITETGWASDSITDATKVKYYQDTFTTIWDDPGIVAVTPFLFDARSPDFQKFSFVTATGSATPQYDFLSNLLKVKGLPAFPPKVLAAETADHQPIISQSSSVAQQTGFSFINMIQRILNVF